MSTINLVQVVAVAVVLTTAFQRNLLQAQAENTPAKVGVSTFSGCLQAAGKDGFVLLNPQGGSETSKNQTLTYKVVAAGKTIDLASMVNKQVEVKGSVDTKAVGSVPAAVPDSTRGTGGAGGSGVPGQDNATAYANGTVTAQSVSVTNTTCATDNRK